MQKLKRSVLRHVLAQIGRDSAGLAGLEPPLGWQRRVETVARQFLPGVVEMAPKLREEVAETLNSPRLVRRTWAQVKRQLEARGLPAELEESIAGLDRELELEARLFNVVTGELVSDIISDFLCRAFPDLNKNNRSTYPDLYFKSLDYDKLPQRKRGHVGPALRGSHPTSVPDGVEVKSQRGRRIHVDCHHDHQGLHLALTFDREHEIWSAIDVWVAYLAQANYTRAARNTTATTEKFSFAHAPFISVLSSETERP